MATINTNDLRVQNAKDLIASINGSLSNDDAYLFVGRVQAWPDDNLPPTPRNNFLGYYETYDNIFTMTKIQPADAIHMIPLSNWSTGVTYDRYQHNYGPNNKAYSEASNLYSCRFYARNLSNQVYVCLDNNNNSASTVEPQNTGNDPFFTSDGYQWLRLYEFPVDTAFAYATNNFMPILNNNVNINPVGAIYTTLIDSPGTGYTSTPQGVASALPYYFCRVNGDGEGAVARVTVALGSIVKIEMVRYGEDYSFGFLDFTAGNVYESLPDLDNNRSGLDPRGNGDFRSTVIIPPPTGWGNDLARDLGGTRVGIFSELNYALFATYFPSAFRQIGILQNPVLNVPDSSAVQVCYAVKVKDVNPNRTYSMGEVITQQVTIDDETRFAKGLVVGYDSINGVIRYTQSQDNVDSNDKLYRFQGSSPIIGEVSRLSAKPDIEANGIITLVNFVNGYAQPELTKYTGDLTYISNISPVTKDPAQTEKINLIIAY